LSSYSEIANKARQADPLFTALRSVASGRLLAALGLQMKFRAIFLIAVAFLLCGCPPKGAMLKQRELQHIDAGLGVDGTKRIIKSDDEVDLIAGDVIQLLKKEGFELLNSSVSWGLQPLTGHTQNMSFRYPGTNALHCYVQVSKKEFQVRFVELESKPQSYEFATNDADLKAMQQAAETLNEFAKQKIPGRSIRISTFDRAESPNKSNQQGPSAGTR
jgi:hypothetical protein